MVAWPGTQEKRGKKVQGEYLDISPGILSTTTLESGQKGLFSTALS